MAQDEQLKKMDCRSRTLGTFNALIMPPVGAETSARLEAEIYMKLMAF